MNERNGFIMILLTARLHLEISYGLAPIHSTDLRLDISLPFDRVNSSWLSDSLENIESIDSRVVRPERVYDLICNLLWNPWFVRFQRIPHECWNGMPGILQEAVNERSLLLTQGESHESLNPMNNAILFFGIPHVIHRVSLLSSCGSKVLSSLPYNK